MVENKNILHTSNARICQFLSVGNWKGMELLFKIYYKRLVVYADSYLKDIHLAEDIVQELFITIWEERKKRILQSKTLTSFLFIAIRNQCFHRLEKHDIFKHAVNLEGIEVAFEEYNEKHDRILEKIFTEIEKLPPRSREVMQGVFIEGLKYREVAEKYQISLSTVKTLLGNSIQKLREQLEADNFAIFLFFIEKPILSTNCKPK